MRTTHLSLSFQWLKSSKLVNCFSLVEKECAKSEVEQDFLHTLILTGTLGSGRTFVVAERVRKNQRRSVASLEGSVMTLSLTLEDHKGGNPISWVSFVNSF